jgi:anti-sigma factor RsiW
MKPESQHLDFLISQYVDGCLDGANKKSVEQQLLNDPAARKLYDEHREVQDLLDDWGNRIPLINWDEFDQKLAVKLAQENVGVSRYSIFRKWARPVAAAAALFIAAGIGYSGHSWFGTKGPAVSPGKVVAEIKPHSRVAFPEAVRATQPSQTTMTVAEGEAVRGGAGRLDATRVALSAPSNAAVKDVVDETVITGLGDLSETQRKFLQTPAGSVAVSPVPDGKKEEKSDVAFP